MAKSHLSVTIHLELSADEAQWLRALLLCYPIGEESVLSEPEHDREHRKAIFDALPPSTH